MQNDVVSTNYTKYCVIAVFFGGIFTILVVGFIVFVWLFGAVFITSSNRIELNWTTIRTHSIATKPKLKIYFYYSSKRFIQRKILRDYNCVPFNREKCNYIPISAFLLINSHMLACFLALLIGSHRFEFEFESMRNFLLNYFIHIHFIETQQWT